MKKTDIVVIGAGVAGLSAAGYGARAGREVLIVEKLAEGGQLMLIDKIVNYPGIDDISGYELTEKMRKQTLEFGAKVVSGELVSIEKKDNMFTVHLNNEEIEAKAVIIATGAQHRHLNIEGEEKYNGRGVSYCGTCDGPFFRNKKIFVIGGGDTALTDALYLSKLTDDITIVHRRDRFRAQNDLIKQVEQMDSNTHACVIVSLENPSDRSIANFRASFFLPGTCDQLPPIPLNYMPTTRVLKCGPHTCSLPTCNGSIAKLRCSYCRKVKYCNRKCQKKHWGSHKMICKPCIFKDKDLILILN